MDEKKKISKYTTYYMTIGMCTGMMIGGMIQNFVFENKMSTGLIWGMSIGMCIGLAIGAAKDKRLSEHMMKISRIEEVQESTDKFVYVVDESGEEKDYRVDVKRIVSEKFAVGDIVAEEKNGYLVSLESK